MKMKQKFYMLPIMGAMLIGGIAGAAIISTTITKTSAATTDTAITAPTVTSQNQILPTAADIAARQAQNLTNLKTELGTAITNGKITQAQSDLALKMFDAENTLRSQNQPTQNNTVTPPAAPSGGGSGGTLFLSGNVITGAGILNSNGGNGGGCGGGGGRIAIHATTNSFTGTVAASGGPGTGYCSSSYSPGADGTITYP